MLSASHVDELEFQDAKKKHRKIEAYRDSMLLPEEIDDTLRREELRRSKHDHTNLNRVKALHRKKTNADLSKREDSFQWNNRCVYIALGLRCDWIGENGTTRARDRKSASVFVVPLAR